MNLIVFFLHTGLIGLFSLLALRLGKEALFAFLAMLVIGMNLFVCKQVDLFGLHVTASDSIAVGYLLGLNLIQEVFGRKEAQKCIYLSFFIAFVFCILSFFHLAYTPNLFDHTQGAFLTILLPGFRIFAASITTFFLVQIFDLRFFSLLRKKTDGKYFPLRMACSLILSELLDTTLFTALGLWGVVHSPLGVATMCFCVKLSAILLFIPFSFFVKKYAIQNFTLF